MDGESSTLGRTAGRGLRLGIEEISSLAGARSLNRSDRRHVIIHAEANWLAPVRGGTDGFFPKLTAELTHQGEDLRVVRARSRAAEALLAPRSKHIHLIMGDMPEYRPNLLHVGRGPIVGFWYLDEVGVQSNSSLRFAHFAPEHINQGQADYFFNGVTGWMLRNNISKLPQDERRPGILEPARAVIFTQEIEHLPHRAHFLTTEQMIRTAAEYDRNARIYVKPHPGLSKAALRDTLTVARDYQNVIVSDASVHDLIEVCDIVVTQNSAAGFEAFMQKKPVITCAKSDYRHATLTAKTAGDLREALEYAPEAMDGFPYAKYFYWFLHRNLLEVAKDTFAERAAARIREKAFL